MKINRFLNIQNLELKTLMKNTSWVLGGNLIRAVLLFLRGIIIARGLGAELFGTFNIIAAFAAIVHQFLGFPIGTTIIKYGADYLESKEFRKLTALIKGGFIISALLAIISTTVIVLLTLFVYDVFFDDPDLEIFVAVYALISASVFIDGMSKTLLRLFYRFKENAMITIISTVIELIIISIVIYFNTENFTIFFIALLSGKLLSSLLLNISSFHYIMKVIKSYWKVPVKVLSSQAKELVNYTISNTGSRALTTLINNGDVLLLGALVGPVSVAYYNIAKKLSQSILIVVDPLKNALFPQFSKLIATNNYVEVRYMIKRITLTLALPLILFVVGVYFFREQIILLTYGKEYINAAGPFLFLTINALFGALFFWSIPTILGLGLVKFRLYVTLFCLIIGAVIAYVLIPMYEATGVAIGLLVANGLVVSIFSIYSYQKLKKV